MRVTQKTLLLSLILGFILGISQGMQTHALFDSEFFRSVPIGEQKVMLFDMLRQRSFRDVADFLKKTYPKEEPNTHSIGHILGEVSYEQYKEKSFALCDTMFNYGCYHGIVSMAIRMHGPDVSLPMRLWQACKDEMDNPDACIHPLGHASTIITHYDINKAFELCNSLYSNSGSASSCWQGAMMEYMDRSAPGAPTDEYGNPHDIYFPCNTFSLQYEASCVRMHIHYLANRLGYDFRALEIYCRSFRNQETIRQCMEERGVMASQAHFEDIEKVIDICSTTVYKHMCIRGAVMPFAIAQNKQANRLCNELENIIEKEECLVRVNEVSK
jgi:hypothetical protein